MKRTSVLTAALCLFMAFTAVFSGCGSKDGEDMLIKAGLESAARMKEAVCNETYRNLLGASASMNDLDMVRIVSSENVVEYKAVYEVTFDPEKALGAITDRV